MRSVGVVALLDRLGYGTSELALRQDVLKRLVNPAMPNYETPGRGRPADWTPMAVRRTLYIARLRRIGVEGRLVPLLAYLRDGWGWRHIQNQIADQVVRGAAIDRRTLRRRGKAETPRQLDYLMDTSPADGVAKPTILARRFLTAMVRFGEATPDSSMVPFALDLTAQLGIETGERQRAVALAQLVEERRRQLGWSTEDVAGWLRSATEVEAARGWQVGRAGERDLRRELRGLGHSLNPRSWFGSRRGEFAALLRRETGRPTPHMFLSAFLAQAMFLALLLGDEIGQLIGSQ